MSRQQEAESVGKAVDRSIAARDQEPRLASLLIVGMLTALAALSGIYFETGQWYQGLLKPDWAPATWVFPFIWSGLYLVIVVAGWRVWHRAGRVNLSLVLWLLQLALNAAWPWLFFGLHLPLLAFVDLVLLLVLVVAFSLASFTTDRLAAALFLPYALWLGFAVVLNYSIWRLNLGLI